jgi:glutamyl-tRNA reductase
VLLVVGLSHRTAPLEVRERLAVPKERLPEVLRAALAAGSLAEAMILSTCNRVEIYARPREEEDAKAPEAMVSLLAGLGGRPADELGAYLYRLEAEDAVRHAFRVAASLDSMVVGEPQILGQVREAYQVAEQAGTLGATLNALRNRTIAGARRARSETAIGQNAVSVSHVAVELAAKIFGELRGRHVLLVGAGKMSELAARRLVADGAHATVLGGRRFARASELAAALGGRAAPFEALRAELARADIVISGTGAPDVVIERADVEAARQARRHRPLFLIDIAVPRDVDPQVGELDGVFLYDLDGLKAVAEANLRERRKQAVGAEAIVEQEVREFLAWHQSLSVKPLLVELRRRGDEIRRAELDKARKRLGDLTPEQEAALEAATTAIVNKLLHPPIVQIKEIARNGHPPEIVAMIRKLLGL